jgi:hypothetical protein
VKSARQVYLESIYHDNPTATLLVVMEEHARLDAIG